MKMIWIGMAVGMLAAPDVGQVPVASPVPVSAPQQSFEAGRYDEALTAIAQARERGEAGGPADAFLAAHAQMRRGEMEGARGEFARLVDTGDDIWRRVGESSIAYIDQNVPHALNVIGEAVAVIDARNAEAAAAAGGVLPASPVDERVRDFAAFYQLGLVRVRVEDWDGAAAAFERATSLNPSFAYAHYYAGLAHSRMQRPDQVAVHFEVFLKLAPSAPERGAVMSIMRTLRGRR
jgi:tetratricopeptide (TPR) repeat protein